MITDIDQSTHLVAFARLFFPTEAKVAMEIAQAEATSEFRALLTSRSASNLREVDLNETPTMQNKRLRSRVDALMKTGKLDFVAAATNCYSLQVEVLNFRQIFMFSRSSLSSQK